MAKSPIDEISSYLQAVADRQPNPPRSVRLLDVLLVVLRLRVTLALLAFAVGVFILAFYVGFEGSRSENSPSDINQVSSILLILAGLYMLVVPVIIAFGYCDIARNSIRVKADIVDVIYHGRVFSRSFDDSANGVASGTLQTNINGILVEQNFRINTYWASRLRPGSSIEVLVRPDLKSSLFPVRLLKE